MPTLQAIKESVLLTRVNAKTGSFDTAFKRRALFLPMRLIRGLHLLYLGILLSHLGSEGDLNVALANYAFSALNA